MRTQVARRGRDRARQHRLRRILASALGLVLAALVGSALTAPPAAAHATVSRSDPADQAHLPTAPAMVTVWFSEAVSPDVGGLTVVRQDGKQVQTDVHQPSDDSLMAMLQPDLGPGTYVATYRIISEDGHPIAGSIVFGVGDAALADVSGLEQTTDTTMDLLSKAGQFLVYAGALAAAGLAFFGEFLHDGGTGRRDERGVLIRLTRIGAAVAVVGMAVVIVAQTAQATGAGAGAALDVSNLQGVLRQGLGAQDAGILVGLILILLAPGVPAGWARRLATVVGGLLASVSFVMWGHAIEGTTAWMKVPADAVHLAVAAVWFGGLVGLTLVLLSRAPARRAEAGATRAGADGTGSAAAAAGPAEHVAAAGSAGSTTAVLEDAPPAPGAGGAGPGDRDGVALPGTVAIVGRFSTTAFVSLAALTAAGIVLGLNELGGLGGLFSTTYGRLLLAKLAVVVAVAVVAGYNRFRLLPWLLVDDPPAADTERHRAGWRTLLTTVRVEAIAIVGVLALTAVLVNTTPGSAPAAATPSQPFAQTKPVNDAQATLSITPNRPGANELSVDVKRPDGQPMDVREVQAEFTMDVHGIGPITRTLTHVAPGHYMLRRTSDLSMAGEWDIDVVVVVDDFNEVRLSFTDTMN